MAQEDDEGSNNGGKNSVKAKDLDRRSRIITTLVIYYCNFSYGVAFNVLGPAVIDFKNKFETDVETVSIAFTVQLVCFLFGAMSTGVISKFVPRRISIITFLCIQATSVLVLPHVGSIMPFYVVCGFLGFASGGFDTSEIVWMIELWRGKASVPILGQHFSYSLGTVVLPLLVAPFLSAEEDEDDMTSTTTMTTTPFDQLSSSSPMPEEKFSSKLAVPFTIAGCFLVLGVAMNVILLIRFLSSKKTPEEKEEQIEKENQNQATNYNYSRGRMVFLLIMSCCFIGAFQGMELTSQQFLPTFSHYSDIKLSQTDGARLLSGLTIAYSASRFVGIFVVMKILPQYILVANFALGISGNLILLLIGQTNRTWMWVGSIMLGAGLSTVFPAYYSFIEKHLYVTDRIASAISVCGGLVSSIYPIIVGKSVENNPSILMYVNFASITVFVSAFTIVFFYTKLKPLSPERRTD